MSIEIPELAGLNIGWSRAEQTADGTTKTTIIHGQIGAEDDTLINAVDFESLRESPIGEYGWYKSHSIAHGFGVQQDEITLEAIDLQLPMKGRTYSTFRAVANTQNFPLERKSYTIEADEEYKTWWNHNVITKDPAETITDSAWKLIADGKLPASYTVDPPTAYWAKSNQALKAGEKILLPCKLPGVQTFLYPVEEVRQILYARDESTVKAVIATVGFLKFPENHAGVPYDATRVDNTKWLILTASYVKTYGWYQADIRYLYAAGGHETALYPNAGS